jgi:hypothetical protein
MIHILDVVLGLFEQVSGLGSHLGYNTVREPISTLY